MTSTTSAFLLGIAIGMPLGCLVLAGLAHLAAGWWLLRSTPMSLLEQHRALERGEMRPDDVRTQEEKSP